MKKFIFIRVAAFIMVLTFVSAQSAYGPSVHARMQKMEDEHLAEINATALNIDLNLTVRSVAGGGTVTGMSFAQPRTTNPDSINIGYLALGGSGGVGSTKIDTTLSFDLGPHPDSGLVWIMGTNVTFPAAGNTLGLLAQNIFVQNEGGARRYLGNLTVGGISFGQNVVTGAAHNLTPTFSQGLHTPWFIISGHGSAVNDDGLTFFGEFAGYVNNIRLQYRGSAATESMQVSGLYIYGMMNQTIGSENANKIGSMAVGGSFPLYPNAYSYDASGNTPLLYGSIDLGTGSGNNTVLRMNLPMKGSIRVRDFSLNGTSFGALAIDDVVFYKNQVILRFDRFL